MLAGLVPATGDAGWVRRLRELHLLTPLRIVIIVLIAAALSFVVRRVVARGVRGLQRAHERVAYRVDHARIDQRRRTLTTVLTSTVVALIWLTVVITVLGEVGVNLGAFVATATIIGGALAFGAQTLVRDVIAGFFMIAEDQYGVGDIVDLGSATGTVERVSLRVTRIRDESGHVWYLPNGQILRVANLSQGPVATTVDIAVPLASDLAAVTASIEAVARELSADPQWRDLLTDAPDVLGVEELHATHAVLRVRIRTRADARDAVRRAFLARVASWEQRGVLGDLDVERRTTEPGSGGAGGGGSSVPERPADPPTMPT